MVGISVPPRIFFLYMGCPSRIILLICCASVCFDLCVSVCVQLRRLALEIHLHCLSHHAARPSGSSSSELGTEEFSQVRAALSEGSGSLLDSFPAAFQHRLIRAVRTHKFPKAVMRFPTHELLAAMVSRHRSRECLGKTTTTATLPTSSHPV